VTGAEAAMPESEPGSLFRSEIYDQPAALERLLADWPEISRVGRAVAQRAPLLVRLVGHGTSDNAAAFVTYAFGLLAGATAFRDSISLSVYYGAALDVSRSVVIALSQSGRTPDVVEYVSRARARGALTVALTNDPESALGESAELTIELRAGHERAVAATKTYLNELAVLHFSRPRSQGEPTRWPTTFTGSRSSSTRRFPPSSATRRASLSRSPTSAGCSSSVAVPSSRRPARSP
jgi:glucosamine--fructose-6-phosphate aminotransferase (isomerizing)